jgi:hypothetical protein
VKGDWRKLPKEELHNFYSLPYINRNIKIRRLRWTGHVARKEEIINKYDMLEGLCNNQATS